MCPRKFMVVNLQEGIVKVSILRQGRSILKDTNSAASLLRHKAGQEGKGQILLENSLRR